MAREAVKANIQKPTAEPAVITGKPHVHRAPVADVLATDSHRLRLVQKGWENFTGDFGQVIFENGVSLNKVTNFQYDRIATQIRVVDAETGEALGPGQRQMEARTVRAPVKEALATPKDKIEQTEVTHDNGQRFYSREQLGELAERDGINGLRKIAAPLNVKARSIPELISAIIGAQKNLADKRAGEPTAPVEEGKDSDVIITDPGQDFSFEESEETK